MPAALTRMPSGPSACAVSLTARSTSSHRLTSAAMKRARPPRPLISSTTVLPPSGSRSTIATGAPAATSASAIARPMPEPPPVTSALPATRLIPRPPSPRRHATCGSSWFSECSTRTWPPSGRSAGQRELAAIERLGVSRRRVGLHPAQPENGAEQILGEPLAAHLAREAADDRVDLALDQRFVQRHEDVRRAQVAIVLRDLVLEDPMIAKRVPGELGDRAMVLVQILPPVGEDQIGCDGALEGLELVLDLSDQRG